MKFCPHCGNPIKKEQSFCNKCGKHLKTSTQRKSENQIEHMREQQSYISCEERQHHDSTFYKEQKHTGWLIVLSIIFVLLIAALLYGAYYTYNHYISDEQSHQTTQSQQSNESGQNKDQSTGPSIDVFS
ncbi:zinc-ribbon domain-containing protein, partial [Staphylococcus sp. HMSC077H01]